jgi:riboflavin kinase / FMN adenylyltransferase
MKVTLLPDAQPRPRRLAVGMFDGVHLGHRKVIEDSDTVLTFDPHPVSVVAPHAAPRLLTSLERRARLVAGLDVEEMVVIPFDREFASRSAQSFIDDVLVGTLGATRVAVGENFRFGHKAQGDADLLRADGRFEVHVEPLLEVDGEIVSSSHIRGLLLGGAVEYADQLLGAPYVVSGPVVPGDARGRRLGFPTANLVPPDGYVCPGHGVYACRAHVNGPDGARSVHAAAVNVGVRPMFVTGRGELIESYLIDFEGDLYGQTLEIEFLKRLRGEKRFASVAALIEQMGQDAAAAQAFATVPRRS